ncbi:MAG TPA: helix-hairpin-helix domain-containing protein [Thermohalobaculum sp.]|nr:helix-hairpin-helix domain-containing protein [Thermohalobaculum sp.]
MAKRRAETAEPWAMDAWSMDPWSRAMSSAVRFWLSFWPVAPMFGVEWRFAGLAGQTGPRRGERSETAVERAVTLGAVPVAKAVEAAADVVEAAAAPLEETVQAAAAAPKTPAAETPPAETPPAETPTTDDLTRIKGIGPGLARQLDGLGIRTFAQLAALSEAELAALDEKLTSIKGRCFRDDWLGQARALAG